MRKIFQYLEPYWAWIAIVMDGQWDGQTDRMVFSPEMSMGRVEPRVASGRVEIFVNYGGSGRKLWKCIFVCFKKNFLLFF